MNNFNTVSKDELVDWNLPEWDSIVDEISKVFRLNNEEKKNLYFSKTARQDL